MRKYIITALVTVALTFSMNAYGEGSNMVGKTIQGQYSVVVDDSKLATESIAVDGTTYIPLRVAADEFGYDAEFVNKTVILTKRSDTVTVNQGTTAMTLTPEERDTLQKEFDTLQARIKELLTEQMSILADTTLPDDERRSKYQASRDEQKELQQKTNAIQAQLTQ